MKQISLLTLLSLCVSIASAQYIYYRERKTSFIKEGSLAQSQPRQPEKPAPKPEPVKEEVAQVDPPKEEPAKNEPPKEDKIYKTYPDKCPGVPGAIPWCMSYVPPLLVKILVDRYHGYLMTIKGIIEQRGTIYYLQICRDGMMVTEYCLEDGTPVVR